MGPNGEPAWHAHPSCIRRRPPCLPCTGIAIVLCGVVRQCLKPYSCTVHTGSTCLLQPEPYVMIVAFYPVEVSLQRAAAMPARPFAAMPRFLESPCFLLPLHPSGRCSTATASSSAWTSGSSRWWVSMGVRLVGKHGGRAGGLIGELGWWADRGVGLVCLQRMWGCWVGMGLRDQICCNEDAGGVKKPATRQAAANVTGPKHHHCHPIRPSHPPYHHHPLPPPPPSPPPPPPCSLPPCPQVQRFVQLCRSSGGSAQYRWNEQGVLGMVRHVFVPRQRLLMLGDISYIHRGHPGDNLRAGGLEP